MGSMLRYGCMKPIEKSLRRGFDSRQLHQEDYMIYIFIVLAVFICLLVIAILGAKADYDDAEMYKCPVDGG